MTIKVTYNVTDVYMSQSVSPVYINVSYSDGGASGGGVWGSITGTLSNQTDLQSALDLKVPYSGATGNVNLGEYELKAGQVTLDTSPTGTAAVGTIRWNDTTGTSETTLKGGNVIIKNGVDLVARVVNKVTPNTTLTKASYQAVRVSGAQGQRLAIELAQANNDAGSADTIGLVTETIAPNQEGFIMTVGQLEGINTTGSLQGETWVDGDVLYLSPTTAGAITNVKPTGATGHLVIIGYVEYAHANNGKIYVKVMNGWELDELHNVSIVTPTNNQGLFYNSSNSLWENKTISTALGYTPVPTTRNITINGVTYDLSADRTYTISTGISGSGAAGQVTYWTGASAVSGSNNLFWDNANGRLGIGTNAPTNALHVVGNIAGFGATPLVALVPSGWGGQSLLIQSGVTQTGTTTGNYSIFKHDGASRGWAFAQGSTVCMQIAPAGNVSIGTNADLGTRLGVVGDTLLRGSGNTSATTALTVQNSSSTNLFSVRNDGAVAIGAASYNDGLRINRNPILASSTSNLVNVAIQNTVNVFYSAYRTSIGLFTSGFTLPNLTHYECINDGSFTAGVVTNLYGFRENLGTYVATNVYGFYGAIPAASGRWSLYMAGTADNYLAGNLGIGITPTVRLHVSGDTILKGSGATSATTALTVQNSGSTNMWRFLNDGELLLGSNASGAVIYPSGANGILNIGGLNTTFYTSVTTQNFGIGAFNFTGTTLAPTSGFNTQVSIDRQFAPTSGTAQMFYLTIAPTINQQGGANGVTRGIYVNPTLTSAADFRAIETTSGRIVFGNLPTSSAGLPTGALWNDAGTVKIV